MKILTLLFALVIAGACSHRITPSTPFTATPTPVLAQFVPGETYYATLIDLLAKPIATDASIDFLHFNFFTESGQARVIGEKLKAIKANNPALMVRVVLEGEKDADKPLGATTRNRLTQAFFEGSGVEVTLISGVRKDGIEGVTHAKAVRIGDIVLSGSTNLTNTSLSKNNEFNVLVRSEKIAQALKGYIDALVTDSSVLTSTVTQDGTVTMLTDDLFFNYAIDLISAASAGDSIDVTTYFFAYRNEEDVKPKRIFDELVSASLRGARVRVLLERSSNPAVNQDITNANLRVARKLESSGLTAVYLDREDKISHAKIIKVSGANYNAALIGSTNIYRGDLDENHQVNFLVEQGDLVAKLTAYLNQKMAYEGTKTSSLRGSIPPPMLRFWRGYKQAEVGHAEFRTKLNSLLIPELNIIGAGRGLEGYLPALLPIEKPTFLPDEVALIHYSNEEAYDAIRSTPRGANYGPLHFSPGLFTKEAADGLKSGSTIAEPWNGVVALGKAYIIGDHSFDWQKGRVELRTSLRPKVMSDGDFSAAVKARIDAIARQSKGHDGGAIVLVDGKYIMELSQNAPVIELNQGSTNSPELTFFNAITVSPQAAGETTVDFGTGSTMQFPIQLLSPEKLLEPVLSTF